MSTAMATSKRQQAIALDAKIDDDMRSFVELGIDLMEMRDSRLYLELPNPFKLGSNCKTFKEYTTAKRHIGDRYAQKVIRSSLAFSAIDRTNGTIALPVVEGQARVMADNVAEFKTKLQHGGGKPVPTGIVNTDVLTEVWEGVAEKFKKVRDGDPKKGTKPNPKRKLSAAFIYKALPRNHQKVGGNPEVTIKDPRLVSRIQRNGQRLLDLMCYPDKWDLDEIKDVATKESWNQDDVDGLRDVLSDLEKYIVDFRSHLKGFRV